MDKKQLKRKRKNIQQIMREGLIPQQTEHSEGIQRCHNCDMEFEGAYCPRCGQRASVQRITMKRALSSFLTQVVGLQANLPRTLFDLLYRPGYLVSDYLSGKRRHYANPFSTILLLATIFILTNQYLTHTDLIMATTNMSTELSSGLYQSMGVNDAESDISSQVTTAMLQKVYASFGFFNLLMVPVLTLPFWGVFRKEGAYRQNPMNLAEATTAMAFTGCQNQMVNILGLPFITAHNIGIVSLIEYLVVIPLFLLTFWQMFHISLGRFVWRMVLFGLLCLVLLVLTIPVASYIYFFLQH